MTTVIRRKRPPPAPAPAPSTATPADRKKAAFLAKVDKMSGEVQNKQLAEMYRTAVRQKLLDNNSTLFEFLQQLERPPVGIEEFLDSSEFFGATDLKFFPEVRKTIIEININWWRGLDHGAYKEALLGGATGIGKCLAKGTPVLLYSGKVKKVEDIRVGDQLMGPDSTPRNVLSLAHGREEMFKVLPVRGDSYTVNKSHILSLKITGLGTTRHGNPKTVTAGDGKVYRSDDIVDICIDDYLKSSKTFKHVAKGWHSGAVEFGGRKPELSIDPYFLGLWLGDGTTTAPTITTADKEIVTYLHGYARELGLRVKDVHDDPFKCQSYRLVANKRGQENYLIEEMAGVGLLQVDKFIPFAYLTASVEDRRALLAGLIDSDGHRNVLCAGGSYEITTKLPRLRDDILFLARSLGLSAISRECRKTCQTGGGGLYQRIYISGNTISLPIVLPRKKSQPATPPVDCLLTGISVSSVGEGEYYGFEIDGDRRFLLGDFTVTHNTTIAIVTMVYHLYLLSCMVNPQAWYGLPRATSIVFAIMAAKPRVVHKVLYLPMRKFIESMPYFQKHCLPDKQIESEMVFIEKNLRIAQSGGNEDAVLGEAIIGSTIDEISFMNMVLRSKKAEVTSGRAGVYDQAEQVYTTVTQRKGSRFIRPGPMIGLTMPSSSARHRGDFMDKRIKQVEKNKEKNTYIYNKKQYEVVPPTRFCGEKFRLIVGNDIYHDTRVLRDDEKVPDGAWIEEIPIEYKDDFDKKPYDALRNILGISSNALSPFIKTRFKIFECVEAGKQIGLESILVRDHVILGEHGMPRVKDGVYCVNPSRPRYCHIDMSRNADRVGIVMIRFDGMRQMARASKGKDDQPLPELLPVAVVEMACSIQPDSNNEIDVAEVRAFVRHLKTKYGYPIRGVSYDGVDSRESIQAWRKDGLRATMISVDRYDTQYKQLRDAMYDTRIILPDDPELLSEILDLEYDETKGKVDHPVSGAKDIADALAGSYANMLERRTTWTAAAHDDAAYDESQRAVFDERFDGGRRA